MYPDKQTNCPDKICGPTSSMATLWRSTEAPSF